MLKHFWVGALAGIASNVGDALSGVPLWPKTHRHTITVAIVGTGDNLASVKTFAQRRIERFERQKEGLQAFVDAGAVTQREADDLLATIHPANWGKNDPPWPSSWITKLSEEQKAFWVRVAQRAETQYEPTHKPTRWMRDLLGEDQ
jgi:hypothetical protein|tara:strand:+ start:1205 stop:1642 length:438 start_codon:yes stop_codon:yes gene_type:complete